MNLIKSNKTELTEMTDNNLYPLSLPQEAFFYDYLLNRNDCKYNMGGALILDGELNIELYRKAYNYVIEHFDVMRLMFVKKGELLYQQFKDKYQCEIKYYDFRNNKNPVEEAIDFIFKIYQKPVPFESDQLYSEMIIQTNDKQFIFAPKFHHLVYDAAGRGIINQVVSDTYNSLLETGDYPEIKTFSYIDFINDDLQYRNSDSYKNSFEYWKQKLAQLPEPFGFTSKKKSIKNVSLHTERLTLNLHRVCYETIINIASETDATTFQVILGLVAVALTKCYKRNEFIIGMPVLNRSNYKFRNTPGLFMNMMPLKLNINSSCSFNDVINSIKSEVREGYRHQRFPLRDTIKYLRTNHDFNNELFDVTIVYRKTDFSQKFGNEKLRSITFDTEIRKESLSIEIDEFDEENNTNIFFNFNPLVISQDEIVQFVRCFETVLMDLIHFPEKSIKEIALLNEFDMHKILNEFNYSPQRISTSKTIVELFEETAAAKPEAAAVICNDIAISYSELNERANQIANYLLDNFIIGYEEIICLAADRSADAIAALLGIMKTGAAYLPVDIDYPAERIKYIIENSGAKILIENGVRGEHLAQTVLKLNDIKSKKNKNPSINIKPDNLAYVIYTSGSTGKPKGVMIEHIQFTNMIINSISIFGVNENDRVLQFASLGFDASIIEIFEALLTGAALVIADKEKIQNTELFIRYLEEKKVTFATLPPVYLRTLDKTEFPYLNTLITAGEQAIAEEVNYYKQFKLYINAYGPTETAVCASYYIAEKNKEYDGIVPIGRPLPTIKIYILDENLTPVPVGFEGELCIAGISVARGYLNNQELTKLKFIDNPFEKNSRLYKTGDLARWKQDGNIEFLGRIDQQVKIKGNRIELGEIESHISGFNKVKEAVVLDVQRGEEKELVAYISSEIKINVIDLKSYLRAFLPEYMIPLHYIFVDKIPVTQNGKINKDVLRKMPLNVVPDKDKFKTASSEIEKKLTVMFEEILNVHPVGIDDNFFELGGESLKIAKLISKIYRELKREVSFKVIFDAPTVRSIAAELEMKTLTEYEDIPVSLKKEYYFLSYAQKRLWIMSQNKNNPALYNMPVSMLFEGQLNIDAVEIAVNMIVQRHESLRTIFIDINGVPYQKPIDDYDLLIERHDLSGSNYATEDVQRLVSRKITIPFNLASEIPVRVNIIKLKEDKHILLIVIHHIAGDGLSINIIMRELSELYNSFIKGGQLKLNPLKIQYRDYCEYEKKLVETKKYNDEKQYWIKKLQAPLPVLELAYDKTRPPVKTYSGNYLFFSIENKVSQELYKFCKEKNVSLFIVTVAVVNILLHKYSSQEDIIIGSPVAGRSHPDLEEQVGVYINTVALRNQISPRSSFIDFLNSVKTTTTEAVSNSNYPFDRLIQALNLDRDVSRTPVFDVLLQLQNQSQTDINLTGVKASFYEAEFKLNKFDMTFTFTDDAENVKLSIGYNTDLFSKTRITSAAHHISNIIKYVVKHPESEIKDIDLFDLDEKIILRKMSEGVIKNYDKQITIHKLFEEQVNKTPNRTALVYDEIKYNYKELDEKANFVAAEIIKKIKPGPDDIIAVIAKRSELMIVGMLGILKAGAAYMPIEPDYPLERISYMLADSKTKLILTDNEFIHTANVVLAYKQSEALSKIETLNLNLLNGAVNKAPEVTLSSQNLAYVIYTSGSTGNPKGVMIEHNSIHNLVLGLTDSVYNEQFSPLNIALVAPFVFDASVKQIFYALLNGHCLDIVPNDIKTNGRKLLNYYQKHEINVSDGTPIHLEIILDELERDKEKYLPARFIIGGQQLMHETVKKIFELAENKISVISNVYGPTECCDVSAGYNITPEVLLQYDAFNALPIGKPLNNVQIYILDSNYNQLPIGVDGELYIAGEGLARGYINRQDLTDEKFIACNLLAVKRIYKTGDIGRRTIDGNIILSGRADDQIKLRGYRIELNEIENCLKKLDKINSAVVVPTGEGNSVEIAAYYCSSEKILSGELNQYLSKRLPSYMIPSYFIQLDSLPMTTNGKVDKKLLPVPIKEQSAYEELILPNDRLEEKLVDLWKDLLKINNVSLNDNFFKLGGHSLVAIKLTSRIHKEFNVEVNIWDVFQNPTPLMLAKVIKSKNPALFSPIEETDERDYYQLSHSQKRLWFLSKFEEQNSIYNLPAAFVINGNFDNKIFERAFEIIIQRHESFRTYFVEINGEPFQKIADKVDFKIEHVACNDKNFDKNDYTEYANEYFNYEFDLSKAPLLKIKLISFNNSRQLLLFNMHHIISDGWSIDVMINELELIYSKLLNNEDASLTPLRIQYKDYARWQNIMLEDISLGGFRKYWLEKLKSPRSVLNLPVDNKRTETYSMNGKILLSQLSEELSDGLKEIGRKNNSSLFMNLVSVLYILLHKYTGNEDILIGSPVAGRQHYDLENQIGFYINTVVLRNNVNPYISYIKFLNNVKENLSEALDNQIYPFDRLVEELDVERVKNRNPLFDVMASWLVRNGMDMKLKLGNVAAEGLSFSLTKSMFDLSFLFEESGEKVNYAIEYNTALFSEKRIIRMAQHFEKLIESIIAAPNKKIKDIEIITHDEKFNLLNKFNSKEDDHEPIKNVIELFNNQKNINAKNTALVYGEQKITYKELDDLLNKIADNILSKITPRKDDVIAVIVNDPISSAAAVLAVMKTGAAYMPVLPDTPVERIAFIINDSKAKAVLTDNVLFGEEYTKKISDAAIINIDTKNVVNKQFEAVEINEDNAAYVIYTSGSTGQPKGVVIEHLALSNLILSLTKDKYSKYNHNLNELMISSFAFDVSIKQIFAALCNGNTLHILSDEKRIDQREIIKYVVSNKINVVDLTPSLFAAMLDEGFSEIEKPDLYEIFLGSEALPFNLIKRFYGSEKNITINVTNFYGPTECCVESSYYEINPNKLDRNYDITPIGKPVLNEEIFILDKYMNLCPVGIAGEICIAGKGLARQYINDEEKTNSKFVQCSLLNGTRVYKTGDLGRILDDGNIEFLGRMDEQIKLRGYRIELPEIEAVLRNLKPIKECAVILVDKNGASDLAAFYTSDEALERETVKMYLDNYLPKYMIPSYYTQLEKMPLNINGKVNKKLLPDPADGRKKTKAREPIDEIEILLLQILTDVLKRDNIGIDDNFFEIGGHSLNAVKTISQIQKKLGVDLALKEIFYNPVLADIASKVRKIMSDKNSTVLQNNEEKIIVPISDEELTLLSNLQFDDEE